MVSLSGKPVFLSLLAESPMCRATEQCIVVM